MTTNLVRTNISGGSSAEPAIGYSRAVRLGNLVFVSGTTSGGAGSTAEEQTRAALARIERALAQAGATFQDVVRTRVFLTDMSDFDGVGRAHGEVFSDIRPASAFIGVAALASPGLKVEIEVDAVV